MSFVTTDALQHLEAHVSDRGCCLCACSTRLDRGRGLLINFPQKDIIFLESVAIFCGFMEVYQQPLQRVIFSMFELVEEKL